MERRITVEVEEEGVEEAGGEAKVEAEAEQQHGPSLNFGDVLFGER